MVLSRSRSFRRLAVTVFAIACAAAGVVIALRRPIAALRLEVALCQTIYFVDEHGDLGAPIGNDASPLIRFIAAAIPGPDNRFDGAEQVLRLATGEGRRERYAAGIAYLAGNRPGDAVACFEGIPPSERRAIVWTDLALAELLAGEKAVDRDSTLEALSSLNHALAIDSRLASASFIRAMVFERIGLSRQAGATWRQSLQSRLTPRWRAIAFERLTSSVARSDDAAEWRKATAEIETLTPESLRRLVLAYPQQARTYAENVYLGVWSDAVRAGKRADAQRQFRTIRTIAETLRESTGEGMLDDVVRSIDADESRVPIHAEALQFYRRGRLSIRDHAPANALGDLKRAERLFASVSNPIASLARCYVAIALIDLNRAPEASRIFAALVTTENKTRSHHDALIALALYHLALCNTAEGNWSEALDIAQESLAISNRLRERGSSGTVESLISESYDFLGQPQLAWQHGRRAISLLTSSGDRGRARIMVAAFSHFELQRQRWDLVKTLVETEQSMATGERAPLLDCEMFLRLAAAEQHAGHIDRSNSAFASARASAARLLDPSIRAKLTADVDGVMGSLLRRRSPQAAVPYLTSAIEFARGAKRQVMLPQLYLERGRALASSGNLEEAADDFEKGIERLERQRARTADAEIRSGIFDDAADLFHEAVSLALSRGDGMRAWRYVERGRARSALEEMAVRDGSVTLPPVVSLSELQTSIPANVVLIEYETLENEMVIFTISRSEFNFVRTSVSEVTVARNADSFISALIARRPVVQIAPMARQLYRMLLGPVEKRLSLARSLVIIPDVALQQVPFAAMIDPTTGRFLIEDRTIVDTPSASVHAVCSRRAQKMRRPRLSSAMFYANPFLEGTPFENLAPLPASEQEADAVARLYTRGVVRRAEEATASRFMAEAPLRDVIQFAGHTIIRPREPWHSALVMAPKGNDEGLLSVSRISRMSLPNTQVVLLASCSTLRAHKTGVEGVPSIARAFLIAGVPAVIGTRWDVVDGESGVITRVLHNRLVLGDAPADALRSAQLDALHGAIPEYRQPGYWSVFSLLGASGSEMRGPSLRP